MAINKSKSNSWLAIHCFVYTYILGVIGNVFFTMPGNWNIVYWMFMNGIAHFVIDYCTSRGTSYLWQKNERHWFFTLIGFDQALHMTILFVTYKMMF
jgi:membrane-bound metal-dependent hydrolase YbcI (DUF457 family)